MSSLGMPEGIQERNKLGRGPFQGWDSDLTGKVWLQPNRRPKRSDWFQVRAGVQSSTKQEICFQDAIGSRLLGRKLTENRNTFSEYRWAYSSGMHVSLKLWLRVARRKHSYRLN